MWHLFRLADFFAFKTIFTWVIKNGVHSLEACLFFLFCLRFGVSYVRRIHEQDRAQSIIDTPRNNAVLFHAVHFHRLAMDL